MLVCQTARRANAQPRDAGDNWSEITRDLVSLTGEAVLVPIFFVSFQARGAAASLADRACPCQLCTTDPRSHSGRPRSQLLVALVLLNVVIAVLLDEFSKAAEVRAHAGTVPIRGHSLYNPRPARMCRA
jgi:hypothetical protein